MSRSKSIRLHQLYSQQCDVVLFELMMYKLNVLCVYINSKKRKPKDECYYIKKKFIEDLESIAATINAD